MEMDNVVAQQLLAELAKLQEELAALKAAKAAPVGPKNHRPVKVSGRMYVRCSEKLAAWGKVPQQQADLADIICKNFAVNAPFSEADLFAKLEEERENYPALRNSKQSVTYLFAYYRGLRHDEKYAGFIARNFLRAL